ncbi:hypothetical protein SCP_0501960 [Sparassis crispa]|uniref:DUF6589 domain-containing protein n=1 Tax=Sparassis crispa TaxID=139825 RepID=A0A401GLY2_9APHY|nr:hypothetical protein SCP_0501960 [Sparassis crispa]GBE83149.1 hypothetical protein SCP_0501960 [Sparassis crispa]
MAKDIRHSSPTLPSKAPWSLWKVNTLLGRKVISVGWKAKQMAPFHPTCELILRLALPANILDGFRLYCGERSLATWVQNVSNIASVTKVAEKIRNELCSSRRVSQLRAMVPSARDVPLENIILFNRDALMLREFSSAIKHGDVGSVVNVLSYWMLEFHGSGSMPKYADALFHVLLSLKKMDPKLRRAFMMNWLVNLTGHDDGFKEVDLLQEHQNFWAKVIYTARGSNRSWEWLSMIAVSIFTLRDVIKRVQTSYKTPHNGKSHTSLDSHKEVSVLCEYLKEQSLQTFTPRRDQNDQAKAVRDLLLKGVAYANTAWAYTIFRKQSCKVSLKSPPGRGQHDIDAVASAIPMMMADDEKDDEGDMDVKYDLGAPSFKIAARSSLPGL